MTTPAPFTEQTFRREPPVYSSCTVQGSTSIYTYWTSDIDLMVRVHTDMHWPPANGRRIQKVETRSDHADAPFREVEVPEDVLATMPARSVAKYLITEHRNSNR